MDARLGWPGVGEGRGEREEEKHGPFYFLARTQQSLRSGESRQGPQRANGDGDTKGSKVPPTMAVNRLLSKVCSLAHLLRRSSEAVVFWSCTSSTLWIRAQGLQVGCSARKSARPQTAAINQSRAWPWCRPIAVLGGLAGSPSVQLEAPTPVLSVNSDLIAHFSQGAMPKVWPNYNSLTETTAKTRDETFWRFQTYDSPRIGSKTCEKSEQLIEITALCQSESRILSGNNACTHNLKIRHVTNMKALHA